MRQAARAYDTIYNAQKHSYLCEQIANIFRCYLDVALEFTRVDLVAPDREMHPANRGEKMEQRKEFQFQLSRASRTFDREPGNEPKCFQRPAGRGHTPKDRSRDNPS